MNTLAALLALAITFGGWAWLAYRAEDKSTRYPMRRPSQDDDNGVDNDDAND